MTVAEEPATVPVERSLAIGWTIGGDIWTNAGGCADAVTWDERDTDECERRPGQYRAWN